VLVWDTARYRDGMTVTLCCCCMPFRGWDRPGYRTFVATHFSSINVCFVRGMPAATAVRSHLTGRSSSKPYCTQHSAALPQAQNYTLHGRCQLIIGMLVAPCKPLVTTI
jgi:hypothetical protein